MVFVAGNYSLSAVDAATGTVVWDAPGGTTDWVSPAVSSEGVYFHDGYDCSAYAYEPVSGAQIWAAPNTCSGSWGHTPVLKDGVFYARVGGSLVVFDAADGAYVNQLASARAPSITSTTLFAQNSGTLSATKLSDYSPTWSFTGDGGLVTAPVVVNNTVFVGSSGGKVFGVDATTGLQSWVGTAPGPINADSENGGPQPPSGPAAGEGLLIFASDYKLVAWKFQ
jgi:outer membrane protein assembly factor BamB